MLVIPVSLSLPTPILDLPNTYNNLADCDPAAITRDLVTREVGVIAWDQIRGSAIVVLKLIGGISEKMTTFYDRSGSSPPTTAPVGFEPLLDSQQAAVLLQIHPKTLQKLAREGKVPGHRIGDLWRFRTSELDGWLNTSVNSELPLVPLIGE